MPRIKQGPASRGSQKWLQIFVNEHQELLHRHLATSLKLPDGDTIQWLSPLKDDDFAEYRDQAFLDRLGIALDLAPLTEFWPRGGPQWDGLARTSSGKVILVEAKSHIPEMVSPATQATEPALTMIRMSLQATKGFLGSGSGVDWSTSFYQVTNRLAHLYLLRELNGIPAYLAFIYFVGDNDMGGPASKEEWEGAIHLMEVFLGVKRHKLSKYVTDVFIDVRDLAKL